MVPAVSIIIPNYNKGELVRHSLDCLLRQTFGEWQAVVVDDCSTDGSWAIIKEYAEKEKRIIAVRNEINKGGNYCRNRGAAIAKGKYLIFLDSDDWLADTCVEKRCLEFEEPKNAVIDLLVFNMAMSKDGKVCGTWRSGDRRKPLLSFLRHEIAWSIMMPIWRKAAFERLGGFDEAFPRLQDVELHTRALLNGINYGFASRTTPDCFYCIDESRMTTNFEAALSNRVSGMLMYVEKMRRLVRNERESAALRETLMAAVRMIGDSFQLGQVDKVVRNALVAKVLSSDHGGLWIRIYAWFYEHGMNKVHGFNRLFRLSYRVLSWL